MIPAAAAAAAPPPTPPPSPHLNLQTTSQILKQSSTTILTTSNLPTFLFLSLLLFSFRTTLQSSTFFLTSFIDHHPSLNSLLSPLNPSSQPLRSHPTTRRRPFLHLSRVGNLDDDFSSSDHHLLPKPPPTNSTLFLLNHFDNFRVQFSEFKIQEFAPKVKNPASDIQLLVKGLELRRKDAVTLFFLVSFLSAVYGWVILGFLVTNSCILGTVFYIVVNNHLRKCDSFFRTVWSGSRLGIKRLSGVILMRWAVRDAMTQVLGLWFFGEVEDQHSFLKLFVRLKLMPFSVTSPWIHGYDSEISHFLFAWFLLDAVVALVFAVDCWVAIMDVRSGKEILKEGVYLISTMLHQGVLLKGYEAILCGSFVRLGLTRVFGNLFATFFQSVVEVYFMVVWLVYYFAVRCKDASSDGRVFGRRDLEDYVDGLR